MSAETKEQRRIRLIEQYSIIRYAQENVYDLESVTYDGEHVADKLISKYPTETPQVKKGSNVPCDSDESELIYYLYIHCDVALNLIRGNLPGELVVREWIDEHERLKELCRKAGIFGGT